MLKSIKTLLMLTVFVFAVSCAEEQPAGQSIGAKTVFDQNVLSTSQSDLDVIQSWESGSTRGNEVWKLRRISQ